LRRPKTRTTVLSALGLAGTAGALGIALVGGPALADPAPSASASAPAAPAQPGPKADRAQRQDELAGALATELGIDKAKVAAALEKVAAARKAERADRTPPAKPDPAKRVEELKTRLDAAVKDGKLTAEESAAILKAAEAGVLLGGPGGLGGPHGGPGKGGGPGR
jgi:membrane-bound lytic murein transglycosylase B